METGNAVREVSGVRVRAWRVWTVRETRAGVRLCSVLHDTVWTPSAAAVAACAEAHSHEAPELTCTCGFHAVHDPVDALTYLRGRDEARTLCRVLGEVTLSGRVARDPDRLARRARVSGALVRVRCGARRAAGGVRRARKLPGVGVAFLSDMHGNAVAFRAALADLEQHDVDLIVSLGDVAQGGPQPLECVELLRELDCPCVFGNSDDFLLTLDLGNEPIEDEERKERLLETARWSQAQLGAEGLEFLRGFQPTVEVERILCCHATPKSNEDVILPATAREEVDRALEGIAAAAVAAGHVHLQWLRRFEATLWFCVGSVGLVYEHKEPLDPVPFRPWSEYALVSPESLSVEFRRIPFDVDELLGVAHAKDFPGYETWAAMWQR